MNPALQTLFYPFEKGLVETPKPDSKILFLNARYHPALSTFSNLTTYQIFKPYAEELNNQGIKTTTEIPEDTDFDTAIILPPKNRIEAATLIATGLKSLKKDGLILCAADNKAGGSRIKKMLQDFALKNISDISKNKCRAAWTHVDSFDQEAVEKALRRGSYQKITAGNFISKPGIFGWDKIDKGSALLCANLPNSLNGNGADFGCGYGYLSCHVLETCPDIQSLRLIDADHRALNAARQNLPEDKTDFLWNDLTKPQTDLKNLDFIIMNPPFHEGKKTDSDIGASFINTAANSLKSGGTLYMVANTQLPYEEVLKQNFTSHKKAAQNGGFKIFTAVK